MDELRAIAKYLVFYGANEPHTGIKGIRSDAPKEAIDLYVDWFRKNNRYPNGRLYSPESKLVKSQILDVQSYESL